MDVICRLTSMLLQESTKNIIVPNPFSSPTLFQVIFPGKVKGNPLLFNIHVTSLISKKIKNKKIWVFFFFSVKYIKETFFKLKRC